MIELSLVLGSWLVMAASSPVTAEQTTRYYTGTSTLVGLSGNVIDRHPHLVKRTLLPAENHIREEVYGSNKRSGAFHDTAVMTVTGDKAQIDSPDKRYTGAGTLTGPAWSWSGFKFTVKLADGTQIEAEDVFYADGVTALKRIYDAKGTLRALMVEDIHAATQAEFEAAVKAL